MIASLDTFRSQALLTILLLISAPIGLARAASDNPLANIACASSIHPGNFQCELAFDGDPATRWASVQFAGKPEWLQIDLGKSVPISGCTIHWEHAYAAAYRLEISDDARQWQTLFEQKDGKGGKEEIKELKGVGRYFRILCTKPGPYSLFSIWEVVFSSPEATSALADARKAAEEARRKADEIARQRLAAMIGNLGCEEIVFAIRQPGRDGHWYANFGYYAENENQKTYGPGGKLCRLNLADGKLSVLLDDKEGAVRDPVLDYDAKKILLSYRKGTTPYYHLYEIGVDGTGLKQLTNGEFDDIEPCYLPDGRICFVSSRCKRWVNCWLTKVAVLHRCNADGTDIRAISANIEHDNTPWPLPDGRILFQRWEYIDRSQVDYHHLWTVNPDGTGQMVYFGNQTPGVVMIDAKPIPNTEKVLAVFSPGHGQREHDGYLTVLDAKNGPDDGRRARNITQQANFRDPWPFSEEIIMAAQGRRLVLLDAAGRALEIFRVSDEETAAGMEVHEPRPIVARKREALVPDRIDVTRSTGTLLLTDVNKGRNLQGVAPGQIKKLLVIESLPKPINFTGGMDPLTYGGSFTLERVLGTIPLEADGSAAMDLPAGRALFFVALDENDLAVKRMQSFVNLQPGETTGCVGCHEQRTQTIIPKGSLAALAKKPRQIEPIADCPDVFDFPRDIQPILNQLCVDCHDTQKTAHGGPYAGKVLLAGDHGPMFSHAYFTMTVKRLFSDNRNETVSNRAPYSLGSSASRILKMLDGSHYGVKADAQQSKMLRLWIELGAPYPGTYAALGGGAIGGYRQNSLVETDFDWPTTKAASETITERCARCHQGNNVLPKALSDERDISFWRFDINDPRLKLSRHIVFNLSQPEKSLMVLAPLAESAGGLGLCRDAEGRTAAVFADTNDPDYQKLLAMAAAGKKRLEEIKRFDMPGFQPNPQYLREMRHYGVLPLEHRDDQQVDPYQLDRKYWQSLGSVPQGN